MKKYVWLVVIVILGAGLAFALFQHKGPKGLGVYEVGNNPAAYAGTITITGVMGAVAQQDPTVIGVMDLKELQCKNGNCNKMFLPVRYPGERPSLGDEVRMTGSFVSSQQGYLFVAKKLKVVRNHKIRG